MGGPNKYYDYNTLIIDEIFFKIKDNFISKGFQLIFIPSMRTPQNIIDKAQNFFDHNQIVIPNVNKKAYLSSLKISDQIIITCDSTSMISEAAITGKPIYVAEIPTTKNDQRFKTFRELFNKLNIAKNLNEKIEIWNYKSLNETARIAEEIKKQIT